MKALEGRASDILLDYIEGRYDLIQDLTGEQVFIDGNGDHFEVTPEVSFYLDLIDEYSN